VSERWHSSRIGFLRFGEDAFDDESGRGKGSAIGVEPARQPLLHNRDQPDRPRRRRLCCDGHAGAETARQHAPDHGEELPVRADPDRRLLKAIQMSSSSEINGFPASCRDRKRTAARKAIGLSDKGFQIRHCELPSRSDTGLEALLRARAAGPCSNGSFTSSAGQALPRLPNQRSYGYGHIVRQPGASVASITGA
jgi:hypothetical protein